MRYQTLPDFVKAGATGGGIGGALNAALNSKLGRAVQGETVVDNAANPASAYSMKQRQMQTAGSGQSPQSKALEKNINTAFGKQSTVKTYGSPLKK